MIKTRINMIILHTFSKFFIFDLHTFPWRNAQEDL